MLHNYNVSFPKGSIITGQQLQLLHDQPIKYLNYQYIDNSDGVISGMEMEEFNGKLIITPGMYKYNGILYLLEEAFVVQIENQPFESGQNYSIILSACEQSIAPDIIDNQLQMLVAISNSISTTSSNLICSFYGTPQLPKYCKDIFSENFDFLPYQQSCYGKKPTYSKYLFRLVYQYLTAEKSRPHTLDYVLISEISRCGYISPLTMLNYIIASGQSAPTFEDRRAFFKVFIDSLDLLIDDMPVSNTEEINTETSEGFFF
ncbi:hypothetical protein [Ruminococcus flavefaciens]|uniref:hypothetical protein n=1 Tax=Ruminococcus flavefaciens TaxID=1265 RepID=UPI00049010E7|nr:hypothetical protein [Ruminococcus flavefaciens]